MSLITDTLNQPLELPNGNSLPNRFVKSAMSEVLARRDGAPSEQLFRLYERWGAGGTGLLITGCVIIAPDGRTEPGNVVLTDERHLPEFRRWASAARKKGAKIWMQLNHAGRQASRAVTFNPVAPSPVTVTGMGPMFSKPKTLTDGEIEQLIDRFARAARVAQMAGFDGIQIHGAHGYLVSQFLSPLTNQRTDRWGGSLENRQRFLLEIIRAVRSAVGPRFAVGVKLNSADFQRGGFSEEESVAVVKALEEEGIEMLEISGGNYESPSMTGLTDREGKLRKSTSDREAYFLEYAKRIRAEVKLPLLLTGGMRTAETMARVVQQGAVDLVGLARPLTVEPDLPARILSGAVDRAQQLNPRVGIKLFDSMLAVSWYQRQIQRMGRGLEPKPDLGLWSSLAVGLWSNMPYNPFIRRPHRGWDDGRPASGGVPPQVTNVEA